MHRASGGKPHHPPASTHGGSGKKTATKPGAAAAQHARKSTASQALKVHQKAGASPHALAAAIVKHVVKKAIALPGVPVVQRKWGTVVSIQNGPPRTCTITIGASSVQVPGVPLQAHVSPKAGDKLALDVHGSHGRDIVIVGTPSKDGNFNLNDPVVNASTAQSTLAGDLQAPNFRGNLVGGAATPATIVPTTVTVDWHGKVVKVLDIRGDGAVQTGYCAVGGYNSGPNHTFIYTGVAFRLPFTTPPSSITFPTQYKSAGAYSVKAESIDAWGFTMVLEVQVGNYIFEADYQTHGGS